MNVILTTPISVTVTTAKFVVSDSGRGTIEFTLLGQPVRLNIDENQYTYDINISVGDRIKLIEAYGALGINSSGIVQEIIPDYSDDRIQVLFDAIYPDEIINPTETHVVSTIPTLLVELPLRLVQKV